MKHLRSTLALASLMSLGGTAWADTIDVTFQPGLSVSLPGYGDVRSPSTAYARMDGSEYFVGFLEVVDAQVVSVAPAITDVALNAMLPVFTVEAPYSKIAARFDTDNGGMSIKSISTSGGFNISTDALLRSGRMNPTSTGGSLSITAIKVLPETMEVYADIEGANGMGSLRNILMWNAASMSGSTSLQPYACPLTPMTPCEGPSLNSFQLQDLSITENGYNIMVQSLGLTTFGKAALAGVTIYGGISVSSVPEPGSAGLMIIGLATLAFAGRRASLASPAQSRA